MPITTTVEKFTDGRRYARAISEGAVSPDDARGIATRLSIGGDLEGTPLLNVMVPGVDIAPDARKIFSAITSAPDKPKPKMAVVASSAPLRVTLSFVIRLAGMAEHTKFFANEGEALARLQAASKESRS